MAKSLRLASKELSLEENTSKNSFATSPFPGDPLTPAPIDRFPIPNISVTSHDMNRDVTVSSTCAFNTNDCDINPEGTPSRVMMS